MRCSGGAARLQRKAKPVEPKVVVLPLPEELQISGVDSVRVRVFWRADVRADLCMPTQGACDRGMRRSASKVSPRL